MSRKLTRRKFMASTAAGAGAAAVAFNFPMPAIAQAAPFKLGLLTVKTGGLAQGGIQMEQGVLTWLKEHDNKMAGRKVEFFSADTGGKPAGTKTKAQELIERDKVDVILGPLAAFELLAIDRLYPRAQDADAEPRRRRRSHPAPSQSLFPAAVGGFLAGDACDGPLRREGDGQEEGHHHRLGFRLRLRAGRRLPGGVREGRRLCGQEAVYAFGHARLYALHRPDQRLRRRLPGLPRRRPAALPEAVRQFRSQIPVGHRRDRRRRRAAARFRRRSGRPDQLLPLHARSRYRRQQEVRRRRCRSTSTLFPASTPPASTSTARWWKPV